MFTDDDFSWSLNNVQSEKINVFRVVVAKAIEIHNPHTHTQKIFLYLNEWILATSSGTKIEWKWTGSFGMCVQTWLNIEQLFGLMPVVSEIVSVGEGTELQTIYYYLTIWILQFINSFIGIFMHSIRKLLIFVDLMPFCWVCN